MQFFLIINDNTAVELIDIPTTENIMPTVYELRVIAIASFAYYHQQWNIYRAVCRDCNVASYFSLWE